MSMKYPYSDSYSTPELVRLLFACQPRSTLPCWRTAWIQTLINLDVGAVSFVFCQENLACVRDHVWNSKHVKQTTSHQYTLYLDDASWFVRTMFMKGAVFCEFEILPPSVRWRQALCFADLPATMRFAHSNLTGLYYLSSAKALFEW